MSLREAADDVDTHSVWMRMDEGDGGGSGEEDLTTNDGSGDVDTRSGWMRMDDGGGSGEEDLMTDDGSGDLGRG